MVLSETERRQRSKAVIERMRKENIDALLVVGDAAKVSSRGPGSFRYLTDFMVYANYNLLLFFAEAEPVMLAGTENSYIWASRRSWIGDVRLSTRYPADVVKVINEKVKSSHGKLGLVAMDGLPPVLFNYLKDNLRNWEVMNADPVLSDLRLAKTEEEQRLMKKAAEIVDAGYDAVQRMIKPGVKEYEIVGFFEGFYRGHGCDQTFNLISSGPFPGSKIQPYPTLPSSPSDRKILKGDAICLEMTAAYKGYWNQLVRMILVGKENQALSSFCDALVKTVRAGAASMKPGAKTIDYIRSMDSCAKKEGFNLRPPMGHYVGLDLGESGVSPENPLILRKGTSAIVHPCLEDDNGARVFWGETYIVGEKGAKCFNKRNDELLVA